MLFVHIECRGKILTSYIHLPLFRVAVVPASGCCLLAEENTTKANYSPAGTCTLCSLKLSTKQYNTDR